MSTLSEQVAAYEAENAKKIADLQKQVSAKDAALAEQTKLLQSLQETNNLLTKDMSVSIRQIFERINNPGTTPPIGTIPGTFNLSVAPGNGLNNISWTQASGATYYVLEYSLTGAGGWTQLGGQLTGLSYAHTSLSNGTQYYYRVTAYNSTGPRVSSVVSGTPTGTSASFSLGVLGLDKQNYLSWLAFSGATGYQVQRRLAGTTSWSNIGAVTTQTQYTDADTSLLNGEAYEYQVVAQGVSATSNVAAITPELGNIMEITMPTPTNFRGWCEASKKVQLTWRNGGTRNALTYEIQWKNGVGGTYTTLATITPVLCDAGIYGTSEPDALRQVETVRYFEHDFSSLNLTGDNYYRIRARYDNYFVSAWSSEIQVTIRGTYVDTTAANFASTYAAQTQAGTVVRITSGTLTTSTDVTLKPGIGVELVTGSVTYNGSQQYSWDKAFLSVNNSSLTDMNLSIKGMVINCNNWTGRAGISCNRVRGMIIKNCSITRAFWQGIQLGINAQDCVITGCTLTDSGYGPPEAGDSWANEGTSFIGNITLRGDSTNVQVFNNTVEAPNRGYGFKLLIDFIQTNGGNWYNVHTSFLIFSNTFNMGNRFWANAVPQFWGEIWNAEAVNGWIFNNRGKNQLSNEYRNIVNRSYRHTIRTEQNLFTVAYKAAIEVTNHDQVICKNVFDMRSVQNCQEVFGDYNKPSSGLYNTENLLIENNLILLGSEVPNIQTHRNLTSGCINRNNTIISPNGFPYAYYNCRTNDDGSSPNNPTNLTIENNVLQCPQASNVYVVRKSTDGNGGGFLNFGNGQATVNGSCVIRGNIFNASVQLLPASASATNNSFTSGVAPQLAGGSDIRLMYKAALNGNCHNTGSKTGKKYAGTAPDRGCYELAA